MLNSIGSTHSSRHKWLLPALSAFAALVVGVFGNLLAYALLGDPRLAIEFYQRYLAIAREIGDRRGEANAIMNIGNAHYSLSDPHCAIEFYDQALDIFQEIGDHRGQGNALGNLGNAHSDMGEPRRAIEYYKWNMSLALDKLGNRAQAILHAEAALKIFEQTEAPKHRHGS